MKFSGIILLVFLKIIEIENRMLRYEGQAKLPSMLEHKPYQIAPPIMETVEKEEVIGLDDHDEEYETDDEGVNKRVSRPCAVVVLSSGQDPAMQTLLRRYRYDSKGVLIPGSVKYFVKVPKGFRDTSEVLVPVNDRAFSPRGGFIRYYKEVPPIPHSFRNRH